MNAGSSTGTSKLTLYQTGGSIGLLANAQEDAGALGASLSLNSAGGGAALRFVANEGPGNGPAMYGYNPDGQLTFELDADYGTGSAFFNLAQNDGTSMVTLQAERNSTAGGGVMKLNQSNGGSGLALFGNEGQDNGAALYGYSSTGTLTVELDADLRGYGVLYLRREDGTDGVRMMAQESENGSGGALYLYNDLGELSVEIDGDIQGSGRVITDELQITGGADLSERFKVAASAREVGPGAVLCIAPDSPGELILATQAYDSRVAGVVSGAGDVRPGLLMGQEGSIADGDVPVALTGRVYVKVDASASPISPGDLLTTSAMPGHAMKAEEEQSRPGTILGKALTGLHSGQGLVLALVSLQ